MLNDKQIKKFTDKFSAKTIKMDLVDEKTGKVIKKNVDGYRFCVCGSQDIPVSYLKSKGRNTLIAVIDRINDHVIEQSNKSTEWIRKNYK